MNLCPDHSHSVFTLTCRQVLQWWHTRLCSSSLHWAGPHFCSAGSTAKWNRREGTGGPGPDRQAPNLPVTGWTGGQKKRVMETLLLIPLHVNNSGDNDLAMCPTETLHSMVEEQWASNLSACYIKTTFTFVFFINYTFADCMHQKIQ